MIMAARNTCVLHFGLISGENGVSEHFDAENAKVGFRIGVLAILGVCFEGQAWTLGSGPQKQSDDVLIHLQKQIPRLHVGELGGSVEYAHNKAGSTRLGELIKNRVLIAVDDTCNIM